MMFAAVMFLQSKGVTGVALAWVPLLTGLGLPALAYLIPPQRPALLDIVYTTNENLHAGNPDRETCHRERGTPRISMESHHSPGFRFRT
jgi:hypothetical protein